MKKKMLSLLLIIVVCLSSSTVFAGTGQHRTTLLGKNWVFVGEVESTAFEGSVTWSYTGDDAKVQIQAVTYIYGMDDYGNRVHLEAESDMTPYAGADNECIIDETYGEFADSVGMYVISKVEFMTFTYYNNSSNQQQLYNYNMGILN